MIIGVTRTRVHQIPVNYRCDDCNDLIRDEFVIEIAGRNHSFFLHSSCAKSFSRDLEREVDREISHYA